MTLAHVSRQDAAGFTLLEIIVALILISIMGAMMLPVLRTNLTQSATPIKRVDQLQVLLKHMDDITGRYREAIADPDDVAAGRLDIDNFKATVVDTNPYVNAGLTGFVTSFNDGAYVPQSTTSILKVTLTAGDQALTALFSG